MKIRKIAIFAFVLLLALTACAGNGKTTNQTQATSGLPTPGVTTVGVPDVSSIATSFLDKWKTGDYGGMYSMLA